MTNPRRSVRHEDYEWERTMRVVYEEMMKAHRLARGGEVFPHLIADSAIARLDPAKKKTRQEREILKSQIVSALYRGNRRRPTHVG
jgi:hypothetical protein